MKYTCTTMERIISKTICNSNQNINETVLDYHYPNKQLKKMQSYFFIFFLYNKAISFCHVIQMSYQSMFAQQTIQIKSEGLLLFRFAL